MELPTRLKNEKKYEQKVNVDDKNMLTGLDELNFSKFHLLIVMALGSNWLFDGYEVQLMSVSQEDLAQWLKVDKEYIAMMNSFYLIGCVFGSILFGALAFKFGRKKLFFLTLLIYVLSVVVVVFQSDYYLFSLCRFMTGVSVGGEYSAIFAAIDEMIPCRYRGRVDLMIDGSWHLGTMCASLLSVLVYRLDSSSWRGLFLFGAIGVIPLFCLRAMIPESPRWLLQNNQWEKAREVVTYIQTKSNHIMPVEELSSQQLDEDSIRWEETTTGPGSIRQLITLLLDKYQKRLLLGLILISVQMFFYQGLFYSFAYTLTTFYAVHSNNLGLYMVPISASSFLGTLILGPLFDSLGRRKMITMTYGGTGCLLTLLAFLLLRPSPPPLPLFIFLLSLVFFTGSPAASSAHLTVSEIFPTQYRSQILSFFFTAGILIGGCISPLIFSFIIHSHQLHLVATAYLFTALLMFFAAISAFFIAVEAQNQTLEQLQIQ